MLDIKPNSVCNYIIIVYRKHIYIYMCVVVMSTSWEDSSNQRNVCIIYIYIKPPDQPVCPTGNKSFLGIPTNVSLTRRCISKYSTLRRGK